MSDYINSSEQSSPWLRQDADRPWSHISQRSPGYQDVLIQRVADYEHRISYAQNPYVTSENSFVAGSDVASSAGYGGNGPMHVTGSSTGTGGDRNKGKQIKCPIAEKSKKDHAQNVCEQLVFSTEDEAEQHAREHHIGCPICLTLKSKRRAKDKFFANLACIVEHVTTCHIPCFECSRCRKRYKDDATKNRCKCGPKKNPVCEKLIRLNKNVREVDRKNPKKGLDELRSLLFFKDSNGQQKKWYDAEDNTDWLSPQSEMSDPTSSAVKLGQRMNSYLTVEYENLSEKETFLSAFLGALSPEVKQRLIEIGSTPQPQIPNAATAYSISSRTMTSNSPLHHEASVVGLPHHWENSTVPLPNQEPVYHNFSRSTAHLQDEYLIAAPSSSMFSGDQQPWDERYHYQ